MVFENLRLIGSSHISPESVSEIRELLQGDVDIVCLELDKQRLHALLHPDEQKQKIRLRDILKIGIKGWLFATVAKWGEEKLGKMVGTKPGVEMLEAVKIASQRQLKIGLIDQNINITLKRLSKAITWREKLRFVRELFRFKREIPFDLRTVPTEEVIEVLVEEMRQKFPSVYRVLVEERNVVMAKRLRRLCEDHPDKQIIAIVGAGHISGLRAMLER